MVKNKKDLCGCGHERAFHDITDSGECIHGLVLHSTKGIINNNKCNCKYFRSKGKVKELVFTLSEKRTNNKSYFYYPDKSCKTKDGGIKMLIKTLNGLDEFEKNYTLDLKLRSKE